MKIDGLKKPKSSFLSMEKDMSIIVDFLCKNERLKKLLYYTSEDCLDKPRLSEEETRSLFNKNIKIIPKVEVDETVLNYIIITFDQFVENETNPEFRDNIIYFDIICHFSQWHLKDFQLRPYRIAGELDSMLDNTRLTGIGTLQFVGANYYNMGNEYGMLTLAYAATHGGEDQKGMPNPADEDAFVEDYLAMFDD